METPLDYAIVHGRADLHERLQKEGLPSEIGTRMIWREGPRLSPETMALGLALGCVDQTDAGFDLSRLMKPKASLRDIFPWGELACECVLMVLMGLCLCTETSKCGRPAPPRRCDATETRSSPPSRRRQVGGREKESDAEDRIAASIPRQPRDLDETTFTTSCERFPAEHSTDDVSRRLGAGRSPGPGKRSPATGGGGELAPRGAVPPAVFQTHRRRCGPIR